MVSQFVLEHLIANGTYPPGTEAEEVKLGIASPLAEIKRNFELVLERDLSYIPADEWTRFTAKEGPFDSSDWQAMPKLHKALTEKRKR